MIPVLVLSPQGPASAKALERVARFPSAQVIECTESGQALKIAREAERCLVLGFASRQDEVVKLVTSLKLLRENLAQRSLKVLVTIQFDSRVADAIAEKLLAYGVAEVLREPVNERQLAFKMERLLRTLAANAGKSRGSTTGESGQSRSGGQNPGESHEKTSQSKVEVTEPLTLRSDCWLARGGSVRKVTGRWMVKLTGPGPVAGRWTELEAQGGSSRCWQWMPADPEKDLFVREPGAWVFQGDRTPEFTEELWMFVGKNPRLEFVREGEVLGAKFNSAPSGPLTLAKDSENALNLVTEMRKTFHRVVRGGLEGGEEGQQVEIEGDKEHSSDELGAAELEEGTEAASTDPGELAEDEIIEIDPATGKRKPRAAATTDKDYVDERPDASEAPVFVDKKEKGREAADYLDEKEKERDAKDFVDERESESGKELRDRSNPGDPVGTRGDSQAQPGSVDGPGVTHEPEERGSVRARGLIEQRRKERASDGSTVYRYRVEDFGTAGGQWEFVFDGPEGEGKWYVFVPIEILNGVPCDIQSLPAYWWYLGAHRPTLSVDHSEWLFKDERPQACDVFQELKDPLQRHLIERRPESTSIEEAAPREDTFEDVKKRAAENPVAAAALMAIEKGAQKRLPVKPEPENTAKRAREAFKATDPAKPTLGPLALSFLMSELLANRRKFNLAKVGERFCGYISS
jgi:hypothetical protein